VPVRFTIIGCGKITERLTLPQLARTPGAEVAALVDKDAGTARRMARRFGIDPRRIWTGWRRCLREAEADAVAVNLPNALHAEVAVEALRAGKHVMVEKPMAVTLAEADAMIRAARASRRLLMVEQTQRFDPVHEAAYNILRTGRLGRITQIRGRIAHAGPEYWSGQRRPWLMDRAQSGGGVLMDIGAHIADLLRWLSGKRVRRLCCQTATVAKRVRVEDNAAVLMEFTDGTIGSFDVSWTTQPYEVFTAFYGERGILRTSFGTSRPVSVHWAQRRGDPNHPMGPPVHPRVRTGSRLGGAYPHFVRCIRQRRAPLITGEDGRETLKILLAGYESARRGRWVTLS
jgi:predicted dehydrogenase